MWEISGVDNRSGPAITTSEVTPRSHITQTQNIAFNQNNGIQPERKPQRVLAVVWGRPGPAPPPPHAPPCLRGPCIMAHGPSVAQTCNTLGFDFEHKSRFDQVVHRFVKASSN